MNIYKKIIRKIGLITGLSFVGKYQKKWWTDGGDLGLRYNHDGFLNDNSIVFDLGGYHGEFANLINKKYKSKVYVFEIVPECLKIMDSLFSDRKDKVIICPFGLNDIDVTLSFEGRGPGAKLGDVAKAQHQAFLKSIKNFLYENNINKVDLIKINIEGAEYSLLEYLFETGLINVFKKIQVQFHDFDDDCLEKLLRMNRKLSETHINTLCYPFVWEEWQIRS
jgi:FkbM family methyltransferase